MSSGMPELGSKISLISKADIRYEGRLYTVDPQECTIALSNVRSFGTEDRETQFQIAPQSQIYDYILFRGSDIKDIRVVNNNLPHPNDPAIMQVQLPNGQHIMPHFPMPSMNAPHAPPMGNTAYGNAFGGMGAGGLGGNMGAAAGTGGTTSMAIGSGGPFMNLGAAQQQQQSKTQSQQQKQPSELNHALVHSNQQQSQSQQQQTAAAQQQQQSQQQQQPQKQQQHPPQHQQQQSQQQKQQLTILLPNNNNANNAVCGIGGQVPPNALLTAVSAGCTGNNQGAGPVGIGLLTGAGLMPRKPDAQVSVIDMLAGASRSTTPISLISRKSPTGDLVNQQQQQQLPPQQQQQMHLQQNNANNNAGHGGNARDAGHKRPNQHPQQRGGPNNHQQQRNNQHDYYNHPQQQQQRDRRDSGRQMDTNYNGNYNNQRGVGGQQGGRNWNMHRGGPQNANNMLRNRNGGPRGGRPMQNQGYRPMGGAPGVGNPNKPRNNKNTIKFEQDFDFEQANNKFEELRSQLAKLKVGDEPNKTTEQMNGETDKKDDSGNETGAGEHEPEDEEIHVGYDKTKSFFDNISCEAAQDRSKNKKNDWRQERKLNSETFGVSSTRRGSYRGRGNYYNRNAGGGNYIGGGNGGGNGGYNRNYRGGNYRNRSNNRNSHISNANNNNNALTGIMSGNNVPAGNNTTVAALKQQAQQSSQQQATSGGAMATTTAATTKTTTLQETAQPQVAAVGAGQ